MGLTRRIKRLVDESDALLDDLQQQVKEVLEQGLDQHVRIAVTGLSRSGKTVFISTLAHHLLSPQLDQSLPFFQMGSRGRILSVKNISELAPQPFPLQSALNALSSDPPHWPASTEGLSEIRLAIRYRPTSRVQRWLQESATLYVDLIDYPGEWLLDLPLLRLDFRQWCQRQQQLFSQSPRAEVAAHWLAQQRMIDWLAPADPDRLARLSAEYVQILQTLRNEHQLSLLQPGRCVLPGAWQDDPLLALFPVLVLPAVETSPPEGSYYAVMQQRYRDYCQHIVKPFYREHFSRFDRQVVLVDCLKALNNGQTCFDDMKLALTDVLQSFNYGPSSFLRRLFSPRIDKVLFASSKADHVTANQHHNLDKFLELIIQDAQREMRFEGIETRALAIASIRATEAAEARLNGQTLSCLKGVLKDTGETQAIFPGEVPTELPGPADWNQQRFRFLDFAPRRLPQVDLKPEHHIRLDQALEFLLGDRF